MPPAAATTTSVRGLLPATRLLLLVFAALTVFGFVALYLLAATTDRTFAWTIRPPLTAAFLGAGYGAGLLLVVLILRDGLWANARVPVYTILLFVVLTLIPTIVHRDRLHFAAQFASLGALAKGAAWFWLAVYVLLPPVMLATVVGQERAPGVDPPARFPMPRVLRPVLALESVALVVVGVALCLAPSSGTGLWSWPLTPLTARAVAAWLIAFGVAAAFAAVGGDLERLRIGAIAYAMFGLLLLLAVLRYPGAVAWERPAAWVFLAMVVAILATGIAGWLAAPRSAGSRP